MTILAFPSRPAAPRNAVRAHLDICRELAQASLDTGDIAEALEQAADVLRYEPPPGGNRRAFDAEAADCALAMVEQARLRLQMFCDNIRRGAR